MLEAYRSTRRVVSALLLTGFGGVFAGEPFVTETDMVAWFNSTLPADTCVGVHAETWDEASHTWKPKTTCYQPFKSMAVPALREIFWRKDNLRCDFYGELFTYDDDYIYLHAETFPRWPPPFEAKWEVRYDRFRLFVNRAAEPLDYRRGRIVAPRRIAPTWRISQHFNTYLIDSMTECNTRSGHLWQNNFYDNAVFLTVERPFSTVFDGECSGWKADETFTRFDEAVVINQHMENDAGRERFFFARRGDTFYGIVRWDSSACVNGTWKVANRTTGLKLLNWAPACRFAGFDRRAREDAFVPPFPAKPSTGEGEGR